MQRKMQVKQSPLSVMESMMLQCWHVLIVGIAMGALGSDAAIEAADVVLMDDKPSKIALAIELSCRTIFIAKENAWFAIGIKVAVLLLATFGMASMGLAVFADVGVMVLAVLNAMRAR